MLHAKAVPLIQRKYRDLRPELDERGRRLWAATEARALGRGGVAAVARATGMSRPTIAKGLRELALPVEKRDLPEGRIRRPGAGRRAATVADPGLAAALAALVDPGARGDPESALRWTCKSTRQLAEELTRQGHPVSPRTAAALLIADGFSLQANRKTREGASHPDRNAQFEFIAASVDAFLKAGEPAVSVDTKKKEIVGDFRNAGREWRPKGSPEEVRVHDFQDPELGKAVPYGVYDLANNQGWVSVGIDHDTAEFATRSVERWWREMGARRFPHAKELLITADGGGSNNPRVRWWKVCLQRLADRLGLRLVVRHFPPGTSKWNKIEHRLFSFITMNWRGRPLVNLQTIVNLIASTKTRAGLTVKAAIDTGRYATGVKVTDEELAAVRIEYDKFHGDWNYTITPRKLRK